MTKKAKEKGLRQRLEELIRISKPFAKWYIAPKQNIKRIHYYGNFQSLNTKNIIVVSYRSIPSLNTYL